MKWSMLGNESCMKASAKKTIPRKLLKYSKPSPPQQTAANSRLASFRDFISRTSIGQLAREYFRAQKKKP
ncbi:hypothetical protein N7528_006914 [Penicillium herquei]|nr:hypothetical protein N7528_006914 [Penicillium herquei]